MPLILTEGSDKVNNKKKSSVNEKELNIQTNLNNLEPGDSVNEHRAIETGNLLFARDEIQQQNNNL